MPDVKSMPVPEKFPEGCAFVASFDGDEYVEFPDRTVFSASDDGSTLLRCGGLPRSGAPMSEEGFLSCCASSRAFFAAKKPSPSPSKDPMQPAVDRMEEFLKQRFPAEDSAPPDKSEEDHIADLDSAEQRASPSNNADASQMPMQDKLERSRIKPADGQPLFWVDCHWEYDDDPDDDDDEWEVKFGKVNGDSVYIARGFLIKDEADALADRLNKAFRGE